VNAPLKVGDPITWMGSNRAPAQLYVIDPTSWVETYQDEGINWIRGHHEPGSPELLALIVAHALAHQ